MITTESKLLFGIAALMAATGGVYLVATGELTGFVLFVAVLLGAVFIGIAIGRRRTAVSAVSGTIITIPQPERHRAPALTPTAWPAAGGMAAVLVAVGLVVDVPMLVLGVFIGLIAWSGWLVEVWVGHQMEARPTALDAHRRLIEPVSVPVLAIVAVAVLVISFSRVLLAVPRAASTAVALVVALSVLAGAFGVSSRRRSSSALVGGVLGALGAGVVVAGIAAAATGPRHVEKSPAATATETAKGITYTVKKITVTTQGDVVLGFRNLDASVIHNIAVYTDDTAQHPVYFGKAVTGVGQTTYTFKASPGTYFFRCEFHPQAMTGTLTVERPGQANG